MKLHNDCKERLVNELAPMLARANVISGSFLNYQSLIAVSQLEGILPKSGKLIETLDKYISESPLFDFVIGSLSKEINENREFNSALPITSLTDIDEYSSTEVIAASLLDNLETLPWNYCFTFRLMSNASYLIEDGCFEISPNIRLVKNSQLDDNFPLESGIPGRDQWLHDNALMSLFSPGANSWDESSLYVQVFCEGFVGKFVTTNPVHYAFDTFKSILGLLIALRAFSVSASYSSNTVKNRVYIHKESDS